MTPTHVCHDEDSERGRTLAVSIGSIARKGNSEFAIISVLELMASSLTLPEVTISPNVHFASSNYHVYFLSLDVLLKEERRAEQTKHILVVFVSQPKMVWHLYSA